jgi:hypothetical protein
MPKRRMRLYIDESGDHTFRSNCIGQPDRQYLCLLGATFESDYYSGTFGPAFEKMKTTHFAHDQDDKVILHRDELAGRMGPFACLKEATKAHAFDADFISLIDKSEYRIFAVLVDKATTRGKHFGPFPSHPYHIGLLAMMERYCGWLSFTGREGDVLAESRGGREDTQLKSAYRTVYDSGTRFHPREFFQDVLTSKEIKLKKKEHNIAGLQISDLLAHPARKRMLSDIGKVSAPTKMTKTVADILENKYNRQIYTGCVAGYGKIFLL